MKINISLNRTCCVSWYQWTCFVKEYNLLCSIKWTIILMTALSIITMMFLCRWLWKTWSIRSTWKNPRKLSGSSPKRSDTAYSFSLFIHSFIHFLHSFIHSITESFSCSFILLHIFSFQLFYYTCMSIIIILITRCLSEFEKIDPFQYCYIRSTSISFLNNSCFITCSLQPWKTSMMSYMPCMNRPRKRIENSVVNKSQEQLDTIICLHHCSASPQTHWPQNWRVHCEVNVIILQASHQQRESKKNMDQSCRIVLVIKLRSFLKLLFTVIILTGYTTGRYLRQLKRP